MYGGKKRLFKTIPLIWSWIYEMSFEAFSRTFKVLKLMLLTSLGVRDFRWVTKVWNLLHEINTGVYSHWNGKIFTDSAGTCGTRMLDEVWQEPLGFCWSAEWWRVVWFHLARGRESWQAVVNAVMNFRVQTQRIYLVLNLKISYRTVCLHPYTSLYVPEKRSQTSHTSVSVVWNRIVYKHLTCRNAFRSFAFDCTFTASIHVPRIDCHTFTSFFFMKENCALLSTDDICDRNSN
jgi:hypothetical protein